MGRSDRQAAQQLVKPAHATNNNHVAFTLVPTTLGPLDKSIRDKNNPPSTSSIKHLFKSFEKLLTPSIVPRDNHHI
jgi:hypothetical protein